MQVLKVLEIIRSPYYAAFKTLIGQLQMAHAEAKDNCKFLESLKAHYGTLAQTDLAEVAALADHAHATCHMHMPHALRHPRPDRPRAGGRPR